MAADSTVSLGCGDYTVYVVEKCGVNYICQLTATSSIEYNRVLNNISEATVKVSLRGNCCECISEADPWASEIAIFRDSLLVWIGPLIEITIDQVAGEATFFARDLLTWADHRVIELADVDYEPENTDLADAYEWILSHAYNKDPWCMTWGIDAVGVPIERYYPSYNRAGGDRWGGQYPVCGNEMRTLSEAGIDYTVVGRHLWGGSIQVVNPSAQEVLLTDDHFAASPRVKISGASMTNRQIVAGGDGGYAGYDDDQMSIYPPVTGGPITPSTLDGFQGVSGLLESVSVTRIYDEVDTTDPVNAIAAEAKSRWDLLHRPIVMIDGGVLSRKAPVTFQETLIPGTTFNFGLISTCRTLTETVMRLSEVKVSVSNDDEVVEIFLQPTGTTSLFAA